MHKHAHSLCTCTRRYTHLTVSSSHLWKVRKVKEGRKWRIFTFTLYTFTLIFITYKIMYYFQGKESKQVEGLDFEINSGDFKCLEAEGRGLRKTTLTASAHSVKQNAGSGSFHHSPLTAGLCSRHWGIINQPEGAISKLKEFRAYQGRWTLTKNYTIKITIIVQHSSLEPHCLGSDLNTATKWL